MEMEDVHSYSYGRLRYRRKVNAKRRQKFNDQWLDFQLNPQFQGWLEKLDDKPDSGYCSYCDTEIIAHKSALNQHSMTPKHRTNKERVAAEQVAIQTAVSCMAPTHVSQIADNLECSMDDYSRTDQYVNEENGEVINHRPQIANVVSVSTNHDDSSQQPPSCLASAAAVPSLPHAQLEPHDLDNSTDHSLNRFPAKEVAERVRLKAETLKLKAEREKLLSESIYWRWKTEKIKEQVEILKMEKLKMRRELGLPSIVPTSTD